MTLSTDKHIVVLYHADCADGFGAAWAAWKKLGNTADYVPVTYNDTFPIGLEGKEVYFVDFCYDDPAVIMDLAKVAKKITIIDHHLSQEQTIKSIPGSVFNHKNSGAVLAWNHFNPGVPVPAILTIIEDRDLWKFKLADTMEINTAMDAMSRDFAEWDRMAEDMERPEDRKRYIEKGKAVLDYQQIILDAIVRNNTQKVSFEGLTMYAVNAPKWFASLLGAMLYEKLPPMAIIWTQLSDINAVSLRSDGTVDVSELAKKYGGGGHPDSAGFKLPLDVPLPWKIINE